MSEYSYDLKLEIIRRYEEGFGAIILSKEFNISHDTINNWIIAYNLYGEVGLKKSLSKTRYSGEFKLSVLKYRINNETSYSETAQVFWIKNPSTIAGWQRKYDLEGFSGLCGTLGRPRKREGTTMPKNNDEPKELSKSEREELIELRERNEYLEAKLLYQKKLDALLREKRAQTKKRRK